MCENKQPLVSIIIPVHNTSAYLDDCLQSVTMQTFQDFEVLCVDDASTDDSLDKLHKWAKQDSRIQVIALSQNVKAGGARNVGIRHAKGKYVAYIDSDDYIAYDYLYELTNNSDNMLADIVTLNKYAEFVEDNRLIITAFTPHQHYYLH